jgi:hypothetical protein
MQRALASQVASFALRHSFSGSGMVGVAFT